METPKQKQGECTHCYLQRIRTLAENAGLEFKVLSARHNRHRRMKGFEIWIGGKKAFKLDDGVPKKCECQQHESE